MALTNVVDFYSTPASAKTGMRSRYVTQSNGVVVRKSSIRKLPKISSLLVYVLLKTRNKAFSRRSRAKTGDKCTKKSVMHVRSCCFAY